jgi:3-hydroxyacyl-[acyl-carrier-protein] dehydratase
MAVRSKSRCSKQNRICPPGKIWYDISAFIIRFRRDKINTEKPEPLLERKQREELLQRLSHPYPLLMVDGVEGVEKEKSIRAVKWVTANEFYLAGHFPGEPILPGVLTLEGMVQSAIFLADESYARGRLRCSLEKVDRVRFKRAVVPGDRVDFLVQLTGKEGELWKFKGQAQVAGETAAEANIVLRVTFRDVGFEI